MAPDGVTDPTELAVPAPEPEPPTRRVDTGLPMVLESPCLALMGYRGPYRPRPPCTTVAACPICLRVVPIQPGAFTCGSRVCTRSFRHRTGAC